MSWLRTLLAPRQEARDDPLAFQDWVNYFAFNGLPYGVIGAGGTPGSDGEKIEANFRGYVDGAMKANGVVFACMVARLLLFSEARFQFRRRINGRPGDLFGSPALAPLEVPWERGTTGDLLARMITDVDLAGNFYGVRRGNAIRRLRPDWVTIVTGSKSGSPMDTETAGYLYQDGGAASGNDPEFLLPEFVCHWAPIPDPIARVRGMSWLQPILEEIIADKAAMSHKRQFFEGGAQLGYVVTMDPDGKMNQDQFKQWVATFKHGHEGALNAYKTLFLSAGADVKVVGADLKSIDFTSVQGHGETRICAAARVPAIIAGVSEGLDSATYCLPADETVWTCAGPRAIADVQAGDSVWSRVGGQMVPRRVLWQGCTGREIVYTVRTKNRVFRATGSHPVLMPDGSWRKVADLQAGDRVIEPLGLPDLGGDRLPNGEHATTDVMRWLGAFIGDGCLNRDHGVRMCIPEQDRVRGVYEALPPRLFTKATRWQKPGRRSRDGHTDEMVRLRQSGMTYRQIRDEMGLKLQPMSVRDRVHYATRSFDREPIPVVTAPARHGFQFSSVSAVAWHHEMGVTGTAKTKRVPGWVFGLRQDLRLAFLAGIVDTDGSVGKDGRLQISFANRELVEDVRMLMVSCAIQCSNIATVKFKALALPNPGLRDEYTAWSCTASSAVDVARIPFADGLYRERVEANTHRQRLNASGTYRIRSIEPGEVVPVYDIEVEGGHSFLADGVVVHNSNYAQARRAFGDLTMRPLWRTACAALAPLVAIPGGAELWYDSRDIPFLAEDVKDEAEVQQMQASTIASLVREGFTAESAILAVTNGDMTLLDHTGLVSVQLLPGTGAPATDPAAPQNGAVPALNGSNGRRLLEQFVSKS